MVWPTRKGGLAACSAFLSTMPAPVAIETQPGATVSARSDMNHSFDIHHAQNFGLHEAILINNLQFWIAKNKANGTHFHDGRTWTYNSVKAFAELFPYMTTHIVRRALERLQEQTVIIKGNYNSSSYDRTAWFAFFDEAIWLPEQVHLAGVPNGTGRNANSLTDVNTDINAAVTKERVRKRKIASKADSSPQPLSALPTSAKFAKPQPQPPAALANFVPDSHAHELAQSLALDLATETARFIDYNAASGKHYADWQAAFRNWLRTGAKYQQAKATGRGRTGPLPASEFVSGAL